MPIIIPNQIPAWVNRVRQDPLGPVGANSLLALHGFAEKQVFAPRHLVGLDYGVHAGEHNQAEVPRDVGDVYYPAGATMEAAKYAAVTHTATGEVKLTFSGFTFPTLWDSPSISVQATSMSENGINKPATIGTQIVGNNDIRFYTHYLSSALGGNATWSAEDAPFAFAIHGTPRSQRSPLVLPPAWQRGSGLRHPEFNLMLQASADLWANFGAEHSQSTGLHATRRYPKGYVHLGWNGVATYSKLENDPNNPATTITRVGQGHVQVNFTTAWTLPLQPFFAVDYQRTAGLATNKAWVIVAPYSLQTTTRCELYIYSYDVAGNAWNRDDTDFWLSVYAG